VLEGRSECAPFDAERLMGQRTNLTATANANNGMFGVGIADPGAR